MHSNEIRFKKFWLEESVEKNSLFIFSIIASPAEKNFNDATTAHNIIGKTNSDFKLLIHAFLIAIKIIIIKIYPVVETVVIIVIIKIKNLK